MEEALRRKKVFARMGELLQKIKKRVLELDPKAEVYIFGSVAEGRSTYSSDIDVLVVTDRRVEEVLPRLWEIGIESSLEIHVRPRSVLEKYRRRGKLIKI